MTTTGPLPKRSDQRRRRNLPAPGQEVVKVPAVGAVKVPRASRDWHPIARDWFRSLGESAQSQFYEPSDWAQARLIAEAMSRMLHEPELKASSLQAVMAGMTELLTSEGARRRARIEVERTAAEPAAKKAASDDYRRRLGVA